MQNPPLGLEETTDLFSEIIIILIKCCRAGVSLFSYASGVFRFMSALSSPNHRSPPVIWRKIEHVFNSTNKLAKMREGKSHLNVKIQLIFTGGYEGNIRHDLNPHLPQCYQCTAGRMKVFMANYIAVERIIRCSRWCNVTEFSEILKI